VCRFCVAAGKAKALDEAPYELSGAIVKRPSITFLSLAFSYWIDNLGFITEGKHAAIFIKPSLGVSNWPVIYIINYTLIVFWHHSKPRHQQVFWRRCQEKRRLLQGEFRTHILYFVLSFALLYFARIVFIKNTKNLFSFIVVILLLLVHYVVP
jgi:hypothetical protein